MQSHPTSSCEGINSSFTEVPGSVTGGSLAELPHGTFLESSPATKEGEYTTISFYSNVPQSKRKGNRSSDTWLRYETQILTAGPILVGFSCTPTQVPYTPSKGVGDFPLTVSIDTEALKLRNLKLHDLSLSKRIVPGDVITSMVNYGKGRFSFLLNGTPIDILEDDAENGAVGGKKKHTPSNSYWHLPTVQSVQNDGFQHYSDPDAVDMMLMYFPTISLGPHQACVVNLGEAALRYKEGGDFSTYLNASVRHCELRANSTARAIREGVIEEVERYLADPSSQSKQFVLLIFEWIHQYFTTGRHQLEAESLQVLVRSLHAYMEETEFIALVENLVVTIQHRLTDNGSSRLMAATMVLELVKIPCFRRAWTLNTDSFCSTLLNVFLIHPTLDSTERETLQGLMSGHGNAPLRFIELAREAWQSGKLHKEQQARWSIGDEIIQEIVSDKASKDSLSKALSHYIYDANFKIEIRAWEPLRSWSQYDPALPYTFDMPLQAASLTRLLWCISENLGAEYAAAAAACTTTRDAEALAEQYFPVDSFYAVPLQARADASDVRMSGAFDYARKVVAEREGGHKAAAAAPAGHQQEAQQPLLLLVAHATSVFLRPILIPALELLDKCADCCQEELGDRDAVLEVGLILSALEALWSAKSHSIIGLLGDVIDHYWDRMCRYERCLMASRKDEETVPPHAFLMLPVALIEALMDHCLVHIALGQYDKLITAYPSIFLGMFNAGRRRCVSFPNALSYLYEAQATLLGANASSRRAIAKLLRDERAAVPSSPGRQPLSLIEGAIADTLDVCVREDNWNDASSLNFLFALVQETRCLLPPPRMLDEKLWWITPSGGHCSNSSSSNSSAATGSEELFPDDIYYTALQSVVGSSRLYLLAVVNRCNRLLTQFTEYIPQLYPDREALRSRIGMYRVLRKTLCIFETLATIEVSAGADAASSSTSNNDSNRTGNKALEAYLEIDVDAVRRDVMEVILQCLTRIDLLQLHGSPQRHRDPKDLLDEDVLISSYTRSVGWAHQSSASCTFVGLLAPVLSVLHTVLALHGRDLTVNPYLKVMPDMDTLIVAALRVLDDHQSWWRSPTSSTAVGDEEYISDKGHKKLLELRKFLNEIPVRRVPADNRNACIMCSENAVDICIEPCQHKTCCNLCFRRHCNGMILDLHRGSSAVQSSTLHSNFLTVNERKTLSHSDLVETFKKRQSVPNTTMLKCFFCNGAVEGVSQIGEGY